MKNIMYALSLFLLNSCNNIPEKVTNDFEFELIETVDSYNSANGEFKRGGVTENFIDTIIVEKLSKEELKLIYSILRENKVKNIPQTFECAAHSNYIIPSFTTTFIYKINGITHKIEHNDSCFPKTNSDAEKRFLKILEGIKAVIYKKPLIRQLPESRMIFL